MQLSTTDSEELRSEIRGNLKFRNEEDVTPRLEVLYLFNKQDNHEYDRVDGQIELSHEEAALLVVKGTTIMQLYPALDQVAIFPLKRTGADTFERRYKQVEVIILDGFEIANRHVNDDVVQLLAELPEGFIRNPDYGLGLRKNYRHIVQAIEEVAEVKMIVVSKEENTALKGDIFFLSFKDFEAARLGINRCHRNALREAVVDKTNFAHNMILTKLDKDKYPQRERTQTDGSMAKILEFAARDGISERNQLAAAKLVKSTSRNLIKRNPEALMELRQDIELVTLEEVIAKMSSLIDTDTKEGKWQDLFNENPFILSLAFSLPLILFNQQVSVGGRSFVRKGEKVADFLFKNSLTDNATIVEIKSSSTPLLAREYRDIYPPSRELAGSVTQALEQKHKLEENFLALRNNSEDKTVERYSTKCIVVAGKMPTNKKHLQSFELFRATLHDIVVVTFDELLSKLQHLHQVLSGKSLTTSLDASPPIDSHLQGLSDEDMPF